MSSGHGQLLVIGCVRSTYAPSARAAGREGRRWLGGAILGELPEERRFRMLQDRGSIIGLTWETWLREVDRFRRVDPRGLGRSLSRRETTHETLGMSGVGCGQCAIADGEDLGDAAAMHVLRRQQC